LKREEIARLKEEIDPAWKVVDQHHLERNFSFRNFQLALDFVNQVGEVAEAEQHHPDIFLSWGKAGIKLWTHAIDGLSESDFILAAKIDHLSRPGDGRP
jgi:4a-hydroxytetrahydrobiopterin dehydratase